MRQQHVEVTLVHRHIRGLAHRATRMVQPFRHVAQLHEIAEIGDRGIAPPAFAVPDEGRTVNRRQHQIAPAHLDRPRRVARVLGKAGGGGGAQLAGKATRNMHPLALHRRPGVAPAVQGCGIVDEIDADLLQHGFRVPFDDLKRFFVQDLEVRDVALDIARHVKADRRPLCPPCRSAAAACPPPCHCNIAHPLSSVPDPSGCAPLMPAIGAAPSCGIVTCGAKPTLPRVASGQGHTEPAHSLVTGVMSVQRDPGGTIQRRTTGPGPGWRCKTAAYNRPARAAPPCEVPPLPLSRADDPA